MLKRILIAVVAILNIAIAGIFLYYLFVVQKKEAKPLVQENQQVQENQENISYEIKKRLNEEQPNYKEYIFDFNSLDPDKLNAQLDLLTNRSIRYNNDSNNLEETIYNKQSNSTNDNKSDPHSSSSKIEENLSDEQNRPNNIDISSLNQIKLSQQDINTNFVKLINAAQLKEVLTKNFLDKVVNIDPNVKLCRDENNHIVLYYGPFSDEQTRKNLLEKLIQNDLSLAFITDMSQEDFDKSCNY